MNVLVTGDTGYIGTVLVPLLIKEGHNVTGVDSDFFVSKIKSRSKYKHFRKDLRDIDINDLVNYDAIIHLAALSNDPMGEIDKKLTEDINYKASIRLAKLAKKANVKRFIFSSSCSVYGIAKNGIVDESSKVNPLTEYAKSKIKTERALKKLSSENFFVGILRNSTVYGYSNSFRNDLVVNNLTTCALATSDIRIMSDGTPWRPLIDVRDLAKIFIKFLTTKKKNLSGNVINIGFNENNLQVKDIVSTIKRYLPKCKIVYTGEHGSDSRSYRVNFNLFKKNFPEVKQEWGLDKSVKDLVKNLKKIKYSKKDFINKKDARLVMLKNLLDEKKLDNNLFWKNEN